MVRGIWQGNIASQSGFDADVHSMTPEQMVLLENCSNAELFVSSAETKMLLHIGF